MLALLEYRLAQAKASNDAAKKVEEKKATAKAAKDDKEEEESSSSSQESRKDREFPTTMELAAADEGGDQGEGEKGQGKDTIATEE